MSAQIDDITGGWDYGSLPANVRVGKDCWLERKSSFGRFRSVQDPGLIIGDRVRVYTWTTFNIEPSGFVEVGDDSILVGAVFMGAERISIGRRVVVSYNAIIADSDFHPIDPAARKQDAIASRPMAVDKTRPIIASRPVVIEDDVWIGIGAIVLKGVTIGRGARIGAGCVVTSSVPAGTVLAGNPGRPVEQAGGSA